MDRGAWWAAVHGVTKSQTWLSDFTFTFLFMHWRRKWQPTPVFLPGESQGWGSLGAAVYGVTQSQTRLKQLSSSSSSSTRPSRTNTQKRCPFHHRGLEWKSRKSRDTWSNRQVWLWSTKWSRVKANRILPRERTGHIKHPLPTTQETTLHMDITKWSITKSDWLYSLQLKKKLYIVSKNKTRTDYGSDHELLITKFRLKLKKVGKTTIPFRYDLNQILYYYTVEVTKRLKGLDLIECLMNYWCRFMTLYRWRWSRHLQ